MLRHARFLPRPWRVRRRMTGGPGCSSELAVFFENGVRHASAPCAWMPPALRPVPGCVMQCACAAGCARHARAKPSRCIEAASLLHRPLPCPRPLEHQPRHPDRQRNQVRLGRGEWQVGDALAKQGGGNLRGGIPSQTLRSRHTCRNAAKLKTQKAMQTPTLLPCRPHPTPPPPAPTRSTRTWCLWTR